MVSAGDPPTVDQSRSRLVGLSPKRKVSSVVIVPKGRIEDPPAPKIKIFSSAPAAGGCLPPLQHISALQHTFSILINIIYITLYLIIIIIYSININ